MRHVTDSESWIQDIAAREYDEYAMILDLLLEKSNETGKQNEEESKEKGSERTDFKFQIFTELEDYLQVGVQHLKQVEQNNEQQVTQYLSDFTNELLLKGRIA